MATYDELLQAAKNGALTDKIMVACFVAADAIRQESAGTANHDNRLAWAKAVFENPERERDRMKWAVLAENKGLTLAQIVGASDAAVQTAVDQAVNIFATGV